MKRLIVAAAVTIFAAGIAQAGEITMKIEKQYLNFPISHSVESKAMKITGKGIDEWPFSIRIADQTTDYWIFRDVTPYKGKTITISYEGDPAGLKEIYQGDQIHDQDKIYKEKTRPQVTYTQRVGWNNDPNGMVYFDGEYHLYYQHNPYDRDWNNMTWGHAVSRDLIHWHQLPDAISPDRLGTIFSGSAVIDYENTAGFNKKGEPALIAIYTQDGKNAAGEGRQVQSIAYSNDKGRTFTKYEGNPVIDSYDKWQNVNTRDPKVFRYAPNDNWVMILNERDGHSIYTSGDLKEWKFESHFENMWECPELFELAIDGDPNNTKWVTYGASGTYMIGEFDGRVFTPQQGKFYYQKGSVYASQTFNDSPDGRRIQMGWSHINHPDLRVQGMMTIPAELTLRTTPNGVRLFSEPVKEFDMLKKDIKTYTGLTGDEANKILSRYPDEPLYIKFDCTRAEATWGGFNLYGQNIISYDMNQNTVNGIPFSPGDFASTRLTGEIIIDRTAVQVFLDGGALSLTLPRNLAQEKKESGLEFFGIGVKMNSMEVSPLESIWKDEVK